MSGRPYQPTLGEGTINRSLPMDRLSFRLPEAAEALGVSEKLLKRACQQGLIRSAKLGRIHTIPAAELARIAEEGFPSPDRDGVEPPPGSQRGRPRKPTKSTKAA